MSPVLFGVSVWGLGFWCGKKVESDKLGDKSGFIGLRVFRISCPGSKYGNIYSQHIYIYIHICITYYTYIYIYTYISVCVCVCEKTGLNITGV